MSATALAPVDDRPVVKCDTCHLTQFKTTNGLCRKCGVPLDPPPEPTVETEPENTAPVKLRGFPINAMRHDLLGESLACVLSVIRQAKGLSQSKFAILLGCPRTYVSKIECNQVMPTVSSLIRICKALDVRPDAFVRAVEIGAR